MLKPPLLYPQTNLYRPHPILKRSVRGVHKHTIMPTRPWLAPPLPVCPLPAPPSYSSSCLPLLTCLRLPLLPAFHHGPDLPRERCISPLATKPRGHGSAGWERREHSLSPPGAAGSDGGNAPVCSAAAASKARKFRTTGVFPGRAATSLSPSLCVCACSGSVPSGDPSPPPPLVTGSCGGAGRVETCREMLLKSRARAPLSRQSKKAENPPLIERKAAHLNPASLCRLRAHYWIEKWRSFYRLRTASLSCYCWESAAAAAYTRPLEPGSLPLPPMEIATAAAYTRPPEPGSLPLPPVEVFCEVRGTSEQSAAAAASMRPPEPGSLPLPPTEVKVWLQPLPQGPQSQDRCLCHPRRCFARFGDGAQSTVAAAATMHCCLKIAGSFSSSQTRCACVCVCVCVRERWGSKKKRKQERERKKERERKREQERARKKEEEKERKRQQERERKRGKGGEKEKEEKRKKRERKKKGERKRGRKWIDKEGDGRKGQKERKRERRTRRGMTDSNSGLRRFFEAAQSCSPTPSSSRKVLQNQRIAGLEGCVCVRACVHA
ncbi:Pxr1, partial [Ophiophagus hannah]